MQELGEILHSARLGKGLTLEDVNERTKISMYVLEALEQGAKESLPHPVYTKGFIKDYALLLDLDAPKIVQEYMAVMGPQEVLELDTGVPDLNVNVRKVAKSRSGGLWGLLGVLALLVCGIWLAFSYVSQEIVNIPSSIVSEPSENATAAGGVPGMQSESEEIVIVEDDNASMPLIPQESVGGERSEVSGVDGAEPAGDAVEQTEDTHAPAAEVAPASVDPVVETPVTDTATEQTAAPVAEKNSGDHVLVVTARSDCWTRAVADEGEHATKTIRYLRSGMSMTVSFARTLQLRLGNAGGVDILLDGRPYAFEASSGEAMTLDLDAADL
jgi:cytoskeleton protein RodZ